MRNAFEKECLERYDEAFSVIEMEKKKTEDEKAKKLLMQYMAEYKNYANQVKAQELLLSARNLNPMIWNLLAESNLKNCIVLLMDKQQMW